MAIIPNEHDFVQIQVSTSSDEVMPADSWQSGGADNVSGQPEFLKVKSLGSKRQDGEHKRKEKYGERRWNVVSQAEKEDKGGDRGRERQTGMTRESGVWRMERNRDESCDGKAAETHKPTPPLNPYPRGQQVPAPAPSREIAFGSVAKECSTRFSSSCPLMGVR